MVWENKFYRITKNTKLAIVFEGVEENILFNNSIKKEFGDVVSTFHLNGTNKNFTKELIKKIKKIPIKIFIVDNDQGGEEIRKFLTSKNMTVCDLKDIFKTDKDNFELLLIERGIYPEWLSPFFDKKVILDKYRNDKEERSKKEILEKIETFHKSIVPAKDDIGFKRIIENYFKWCEYRFLDNKTCKGRTIMTYRDLAFCLFSNHLILLKKVKLKLPRLVRNDISNTTVFKDLKKFIESKLK